MSLNESTVENAALECFEELGYASGMGRILAPCESATKRDGFGAVMLEKHGIACDMMHQLQLR